MSEEIDRIAEQLHDKWRQNEFPGKGYPNNTFGVIKATLAECARQNAELEGRLTSAERRAAIWMSLVHGLPTDVNAQFQEAAKRYDERIQSLRQSTQTEEKK